MSRFLFAVAALAAAAASLAAPANASVPRAEGTRIVAYSDLDLSSASGRARLDRRIGAAVRTICGTSASGDLNGASAVRVCRAETAAQVARPAPASRQAGTQ